MEAGAELLWPEKEDLYALMRMRVDEGRTAFEREKQNSPDRPRALRVARGILRPPYLVRRLAGRSLQLRVIALDPSKGADARHGDYSAYVMWGSTSTD